MTTAACTRPMVDSPSALAFKAFTTFSTHADSLCFFLQAEAFRLLRVAFKPDSHHTA